MTEAERTRRQAEPDATGAVLRAERERLPPLLPPPGADRRALARAGERAAALVADPGFVARLAPLLVEGESRRQRLAAGLAENAIELPGLALGLRLPALLFIDRLRSELANGSLPGPGALPSAARGSDQPGT